MPPMLPYMPYMEHMGMIWTATFDFCDYDILESALGRLSAAEVCWAVLLAKWFLFVGGNTLGSANIDVENGTFIDLDL